MATEVYPTTVEDIFNDYLQRKNGILRALTAESDRLFASCDPKAPNLCLYGNQDGTWTVGPPSPEVPPELPEPCLGINFARDGMKREDWLALLAVHSDTWLLAVAFYYGVKLDQSQRQRLFKAVNTAGPTLFEMVTNRKPLPAPAVPELPAKRQRVDRPHAATKPTGTLLQDSDIKESLQGRQAELYWPDDQKWYLVEIQSVDVKARRAQIVYASGEFEDVDLAEVLREGHMCLFAD